MVVMAMTSCGGDDEKGGIEGPNIGKPVSAAALAGDWHLESWDSASNIDVYISFDANGNFELYQLAEHAGYDYYTGRYSLESDGKLLTGVYSDNVPWATSYACGIDDSGTTLKLFSQNDEGVLSCYVKTTIPENIKDWVVTKAVAGENGSRWF